MRSKAEAGDTIKIVPCGYRDSRYEVGDKFKVLRRGFHYPGVFIDTPHERGVFVGVFVNDEEYIIVGSRGIEIVYIAVMAVVAVLAVAVVVVMIGGAV